MSLEKFEECIKELENALQRLGHVKRHLSRNSSEIKSQIHASISRHLETLRNREVWLLGQVDVVMGMKEEVLHAQQAHLNKALGILHSRLAHTAGVDDDTANRLLAQTLDELNALKLKSEETPYIAFRADHVALRESILNYGRVDSKGWPLHTAFADENTTSASLPRHFEEYEDSEHHLFYKDLRTSSSAPNNIMVSMPKLSARVEDWLQRPILHLSASMSEDDVQILDSVSKGSRGASARSTCSIQNWLSQIKHNPDLEEEDDFEIVDNSSPKETPVEEVKDLFKHIPQDIRVWLSSNHTVPVEEDLHAFFRHIPQDSSVWLATARRQLESLEDLKQRSWFHHIPKDVSTWLRRTHDKRAAVQSTMEDFFAHIPRDKKVWLVNKDHDNLLETDIKISTPLRSTSPSLLLKACPNNISSTQELWLKRKMSSPISGELVDRSMQEDGAFSLTGSKDLDPSLGLTRQAKEVKKAAELPDFFAHVSTNVNDWLSSNKSISDRSSLTPSISVQKIAKEDKNLWLWCSASRNAQKSEVTSPLDSFLRAHSHFTSADWLIGARRGTESLESNRSSSSMASTEKNSLLASQQPTWIYQKQL